MIPNCKCETIKESYINFMAEKSEYCFSLYITPNVGDILLVIVWVYQFQSMYSFIVNPKKLNSVTRSIWILFFIRHRIKFYVMTFDGNKIYIE